MQYSILSLGLAALAHGHSIMQSISVDGNDQGKLTGLRAPETNFPVEDVNSPNLACGQPGHVDSTVIQVPAGSQVAGYWWTDIYGGQHPDNPIAASHKGPVTYWLARVDDAATAGLEGLEWFKVAEDNLDTSTGTWGVDNVVSNDGWHSFHLPECIADGQYLLRVELLALHSAGGTGGAQFYGSCAQIEVTGGGDFSPAETAQIPGSYSAEDPSIKIAIYDASGVPNNSNQPYQAPGMRPITC
jgi:cellulase